jgi:hypothetical protein
MYDERMRRSWCAPALLAIAAVGVLAREPDVLTSVRGIPAHLAGQFEEPIGFQQEASGDYLVFDRRAHAVYRIDASRTTATRVIDIGPEPGRVLGPTAFDVAPNGIIAVADAPQQAERIQFFNTRGERIGGFSLPGRAAPRVVIGTLVLSGVGSLQFTGRSVLMNQPEAGGLITEYGLAGTALRTIGALRPTGHEDDRDVHLALNVGLPVVNPQGGFYFVFQAGEPRLRKYSSDGGLLFERTLQGKEIDGLMQAMPTTWPRRDVGGRQLPVVPPVVRAAAADPEGRLWISLVTPVTYVFDADGDLVRRVQFKAAGIVSPASLFFASRSRLLISPGLYEFRVE